MQKALAGRLELTGFFFVDAYWNKLKTDLEKAAESYGLQDNREAAAKARVLRQVLRHMEGIEGLTDPA
jgi:hypothetical protein